MFCITATTPDQGRSLTFPDIQYSKKKKKKKKEYRSVIPHLVCFWTLDTKPYLQYLQLLNPQGGKPLV